MASVKLTLVDNQIDKDDDDRVKHIYTTHEIQGNRYELELMEESNGTIKLFSLIPDIALSLKRGTTLVIDELDAKLHPLLLKYIITLYTTSHLGSGMVNC